MNWLLTAFAESATTATDPTQGNNLLVFLVQFGPIILLFGLMYVFLILPQKKMEKKDRELRESAIVGDKVVSLADLRQNVKSRMTKSPLKPAMKELRLPLRMAIKEVDKPISE